MINVCTNTLPKMFIFPADWNVLIAEVSFFLFLPFLFVCVLYPIEFSLGKNVADNAVVDGFGRLSVIQASRQ